MKELRFCEEHRYRYEEAAHVTPNSQLYKAQDLTLNRTVALKKVKISGTGKREIEGNYRRALQEVKTMVQISENTVKLPNIFCTWYEEQAAELFIVMQWIGGETLAKKMERKLSPVLFIKWMRELCQILDVMAVRGFVHKDIKPENIMFDKNNDLYLIDFNISVSVPNQTEGTLFYKAPEMEEGSGTMSRDKVDMFALGVMLYQQFTKTIPQRMIDYDIYDAKGEKWDLFTEPSALVPGLSPRLNQIIVKLMAYNPRDRYYSYGELMRDLKAVEKELQSGQRQRRD